MNIHANTTSRLGDDGTLLEGVIDAFDAVIEKGQEKTRGQLRSACACVKWGNVVVSEGLQLLMTDVTQTPGNYCSK